jgi:hypothetical protein
LRWSARQLAASVRVFAWLAVLHAVPIAVIASLPLETWPIARVLAPLVFPGRIAELIARRAGRGAGQVPRGGQLRSLRLLAYHARRPVPVFGVGTSHARQDDIRTDWRALAGRDFVILRREPPLAQDYQPYFREHRGESRCSLRRHYHAVIGSGFDYAAYRAGVLTDIRDRFYRFRRAAGRALLFLRALLSAMIALAAASNCCGRGNGIKNAFVLVGLVFGHAWRDPRLVQAALPH